MPADKFEKAFGLPWTKALADGTVFNALDACTQLGVDAAGLDALWAGAKKVKFGGGFYCGLITVPGKKPIYVFNGFFMEMRGKYVQKGSSIHCKLHGLRGERAMCVSSTQSAPRGVKRMLSAQLRHGSLRSRLHPPPPPFPQGTSWISIRAS